PECEILIGSTATRAVIRQGQFFKLATAMEGGGQDGNWSFARYREWLDAKADWSLPSERVELPDAPPDAPAPLPPLRASGAVAPRKPRPEPRVEPAPREDGVVVIDDAEDPEEILAELDRRRH